MKSKIKNEEEIIKKMQLWHKGQLPKEYYQSIKPTTNTITIKTK